MTSRMTPTPIRAKRSTGAKPAPRRTASRHQENGDRKRRRRGRRGGRRNRRHREGNGNVAEGNVSEGHVSEVMGDDEGQPYQRDGADDMSSAWS